MSKGEDAFVEKDNHGLLDIQGRASFALPNFGPFLHGLWLKKCFFLQFFDRKRHIPVIKRQKPRCICAKHEVLGFSWWRCAEANRGPIHSIVQSMQFR
jgi:hypothetical protein